MKPLLIVDGYNIIGAWPEAARNGWDFEESREKLLHALRDFGGYAGYEIVLVFDGYLSDRRTTTEEDFPPVRQVFTRHAETADSYIERLVAQMPRYRQVMVATSDGLEQSQVLSTGATRMTARELLRELHQTREEGLRRQNLQQLRPGKNIEDHLPEELREKLERMRRGGAT